MAYDESLAKRIDVLIKDSHANAKKFTRKEMFEGVAYLLSGNMCVGADKNELIVRYDPKLTDDLASDKQVRPFDITGRAMKGWALVKSDGIKGTRLNKWFAIFLGFVKSLPAKN